MLCRFVFVCMCIMSVCINVYSSNLTWGTLMVQLPAVYRRCTRQLGSTLQHHWPQICSLYHFIAVCCIQLWLLLYCVLNGCWHVCHFGCSHSLYMDWARAPTPRDSGERLRKNYGSCANMWVVIEQDITLRKRWWRYCAFLSVSSPSRWLTLPEQQSVMGDKDIITLRTFTHLHSCLKLLLLLSH